MRRLAALVLATLFAACTLPGASDTTTSGAGGSIAACQQTSCAPPGGGGCVTCAIDGACAADYQACLASPDCQSIDGCWAGCSAGDTTCQSACLADNPDGADAYQELNSCIYCTTCATACPGQCMSSS
jgi:hypothetical protein